MILMKNQYINSLQNRQNQRKEIDQLKDEMVEIKQLLKQMLEKNGSF